MPMIDAVKTVFSKYTIFSGRARRAEYWWFYLALAIASTVLGIILMPIAYASVDSTTGAAGGVYLVIMALFWLLGLALLLPTLAVTVRRLHDTGRSGAWFWISLIPFVGSIILIVFLATPGDAGANRFGPDPKGVYPAA